mmetsp:Transcript_24434/g.46305  ORF Transcript_24434/g.46305 Transcript_24434/m.46305 type:complete len:239 (+) Transcript_24434:4051-4767(+)
MASTTPSRWEARSGSCRSIRSSMNMQPNALVSRSRARLLVAVTHRANTAMSRKGVSASRTRVSTLCTCKRALEVVNMDLPRALISLSRRANPITAYRGGVAPAVHSQSSTQSHRNESSPSRSSGSSCFSHPHTTLEPASVSAMRVITSSTTTFKRVSLRNTSPVCSVFSTVYSASWLTAVSSLQCRLQSWKKTASEHSMRSWSCANKPSASSITTSVRNAMPGAPETPSSDSWEEAAS